ncbi:MAG: hypothetical protein CVT71_01960 [Alphaproteobacteria bacterium HGW-Alphaproteobacteria-10]|jgi:hypothetical protein|nr:MAG: hypothetical protein CVT71_01960 [Alphaproteobacteria bacterium HGW-Alphaproteobacteria-10]
MARVLSFPRITRDPLRCPGIGRDSETPKILVVYLNRAATDDEMRFLHEVLQRAAPSAPKDD